MPKISVIIPVFNTSEYLKKNIDSIINQTLSDFEVIYVDDGSSDNSLGILEIYAAKDSRIKILKQSNAGAGVARNNGLSQANGEYLLFLDSDDFFSPSLFEHAYNKAISEKADIVIYRVNTYNEKTKKYSDAHWAYRREYLPTISPFCYKDILKHIFNSFQNWPWNKMFKHDFVKSNQLSFQPLLRTNDLFFTCTALVCAKRISLLDEVLVYYRNGISTNSQANNELAPTDFLKAFLALKNYLLEHKIYSKVEQSFKNLVITGSLYNLQTQKNERTFELVYNLLHNEAFENLGLIGLDIDYFYDKSNAQHVNDIVKLSYSQYLFRKNLKLQTELNAIKNDLGIDNQKNFDLRSYKLGRILTFIPRVCKKIISSLYNQGVKATFSIIKIKSKEKIGNIENHDKSI